MRFLSLAILSLPFAAVPAAQAQDACSQADPCPWDVVVDAPGFIGESEWNWTLGDWMRLTVANDDEVAHTVTLSGYGLQFQVPSLEERSQVVQFTQAGRFTLSDGPSGDTVDVTVVDGDVVDYEKGLIDASGNALTSASGTGRIPGLGLPILAIGLLAVALARKA